ncbi:histone-lysine N-methyltransferase, H3 lysine-9 specific SUVH1-like [Abrus precatorius]|uniref:Histone-lysine N-methyltransferase, H3 lysine-9 specific SUVH1-like n=1 Tax=Abrus precatorius TaxID=3816 RepID=A0A8B8KD95_ABRPR|nr:histone-lysine N-methyltransferase, H3 lysine-9 specific SUVH1-like [Abrus precatorius]XP_027341758.1 histone-lysine N-methyltransferase, H3 lysine-9 specific SUVH1-like [Abrus precatorius]XP_027341759.1 histone-lysine N-methyltransferase, H3 lysine-9 specific SUVH1-like [Abrus precatorius]
MEQGFSQNSVPPPGSIDKSRILDIKPMRCLIPVFPMSSQAAPSGEYPSGFSPFFPFGAPHQTPTGVAAGGGAIPAPIRAFRSPLGAGDTSATVEGDTSGKKKRGRPRLNKSPEKNDKISQESHVDVSALVGISPAQRDDGSREVVNLVLMTFDALRRRLCQLEEAKELSSGSIKRADLKVSNTLMSKGIRTNMRKRIGPVPGVEIGDIFFFRIELCLAGLHAPSMGGIDALHIRGEFEEETLAVSIVSSGEYDDDAEDSDVIIYTGQGGNFFKKGKHAIDQKLHRGNLALDRSSRQHNEVRVIRGMKDGVNQNAKIYVYDGLYKIQDSWIEKAKSGGGIFKYKLVRMAGQPSAFAVLKSVQKWKSGSPRTGLTLADLSSGAESIPVPLVNEVDNVKAPAYFTYFHSIKHPKSFSLMQPSHGCCCTKACIPGDLNCSCIRRNEGDFPYTGSNILVSRKPLVHECGPTCQCFPNCKNRVSQTGLKHHMEVFKTKDRGWGLRSLDPIRAGTFICEYAGEVIDRAKVSQLVREGDEYVFDTTRIYDKFKWNYEPRLLEEVGTNDSSEDYAIPYPLIISAKNVGNVARFMNHSCSPNVFWQPVIYEENNQSYLHVAFFALRHIPPMKELTYDYGFAGSDRAEGSSASKGRKKCLCGSSKCRGSFG